MPVCSERDDVIVITDEAHRTQYSTLALNMRTSLPNASFLGFTGTPLIAGDLERTREVFGDYVPRTTSATRSRTARRCRCCSTRTGSPSCRSSTMTFDAELSSTSSSRPELDEQQWRSLAAVQPRLPADYALRSARAHRRRPRASFRRPGLLGRRCSSPIDKATAVRMYDLVQRERAVHLAELEEFAGRLPPLEREGWMRRSRSCARRTWPWWSRSPRSGSPEMRRPGWTSLRIGEAMLDEDLGERFTDPDDRFRLVFVCAMWMTGLTCPRARRSTSTSDAEPHPHADVARANRVFPEKEDLIVDSRRRVPPSGGGARDLRGRARGLRTGPDPRQAGARRRVDEGSPTGLLAALGRRFSAPRWGRGVQFTRATHALRRCSSTR